MDKETLSYILAGFSIWGVVVNMYHDKRCFIIWGFTNLFWTVYFVMHKLYAPAFLQAIYFILAIWGLWKWSQDEWAEENDWK